MSDSRRLERLLKQASASDVSSLVSLTHELARMGLCTPRQWSEDMLGQMTQGILYYGGARWLGPFYDYYTGVSQTWHLWTTRYTSYRSAFAFCKETSPHVAPAVDLDIRQASLCPGCVTSKAWENITREYHHRGKLRLARDDFPTYLIPQNLR